MTVSLTHPHSPFTATQQQWDRYDHAKIDMPKTEPIPVEDLDTHSRWLYYSHGRDRLEVTPEHVRNARHAYYGMISYVDDKVGEFLNLLRQGNLMDDTIFIFTADHGEMMGERGMWFKQTFFEHSTRIPLIINAPGLPKGKVVDSNVSLVDLLPTVLSMADNGRIDVRSPIDGADMTKLMFGSDASWCRRVLSEYSDMGVCAPCRMVREDQYKMMYVHGHESLLFDLAADPEERQNLSGDAKVAAVEKKLRASLLDGWDPELINARVLESQAARQVIWSAMKDDPGDNSSYEFRKGDQQRFVRSGGGHDVRQRSCPLSLHRAGGAGRGSTNSGSMALARG